MQSLMTSFCGKRITIIPLKRKEKKKQLIFWALINGTWSLEYSYNHGCFRPNFLTLEVKFLLIIDLVFCLRMWKFWFAQSKLYRFEGKI